MVVKLKGIKAELLGRKHDRTATVGAWLRTIVLGYYLYHTVPGNATQLRIFQPRANLAVAACSHQAQSASTGAVEAACSTVEPMGSRTSRPASLS
jgi:hypothetical protein